jgi:hypothetical protein
MLHPVWFQQVAADEYFHDAVEAGTSQVPLPAQVRPQLNTPSRHV